MGRIKELRAKIEAGEATEEEKDELKELEEEAAEVTEEEPKEEETEETTDEKSIESLVDKFVNKAKARLDKELEKINKDEKSVETKTITKKEYDAYTKEEKIGEFIKALFQNDRQKLQVMVEGTNALGGFLVPTVWLDDIVEEIRDMTVIRPRATVIPMTTNQLNVTQLVSRPIASWRSEAAVNSTRS